MSAPQLAAHPRFRWAPGMRLLFGWEADDDDGTLVLDVDYDRRPGPALFLQCDEDQSDWNEPLVPTGRGAWARDDGDGGYFNPIKAKDAPRPQLADPATAGCLLAMLAELGPVTTGYRPPPDMHAGWFAHLWGRTAEPLVTGKGPALGHACAHALLAVWSTP